MGSDASSEIAYARLCRSFKSQVFNLNYSISSETKKIELNFANFGKSGPKCQNIYNKA